MGKTPKKDKASSKKKLIKTKIYGKLSDAVKKYTTKDSEKKISKKLKKASKSITALVLKTKQGNLKKEKSTAKNIEQNTANVTD
jgi:hypothetical protein